MIRLYIGTYTDGDSEGIYLYQFDPSSGALEFESSVSVPNNPGFLAIHPQARFLYSVNEVEEVAGEPGGGVSAFSIDPGTGNLTFINQQSSKGAHPCHLSVDATGKFVFVANYGGGSLCVLPIREDGGLGEATDVVQHTGTSVHPRRQKAPHTHSVFLDSSNRYAFSPDLGIDKVMIYRLDLDAGKLIPNDPPWASIRPGAGPRHFAFHPDGKFAFVINEIDSSLTAFNYDSKNGSLNEIETLSTLPSDFEGQSTCADIHVSPSGKFVYGSNRGHDSIAIFEIDAETGRLRLVGHEPTQGKQPRNFAIDPTGTFLLAANQVTNTIVTFRIDQASGSLTPTGNIAEVPAPVCLKMVSV